MQSNTNTTDINSSRQESNHNTESPVGNSFNPDLDIDLPDISAKISSASMGRLQQFYDKHKLYTKLVIILFVLALLGVLIAVSSSESDKYSRILLGFGLGLFFVAIILTINFSLLSSRNTKTATVTFKTIAVHQELCRYIENPEMMKNVYVYKDNASSISTNEDLSGSQKPEFVMRALGIVNPKCEESHITEWIHGIYHGKPFRFFEVKLFHVYEGSKHTRYDLLYQGQGYIFKTKAITPISIQYDFNANASDLSMTNFENVFSVSKYEQSSQRRADVGVYTAKEKLSQADLDVLNALETPEFKTCLIKLALIFKKFTRPDDNSDDDSQPKWYVRLQNQNIIILREGRLDYFEINLHKAPLELYDKYNWEMSEFLSVLETMDSLPQISGESHSEK